MIFTFSLIFFPGDAIGGAYADSLLYPIFGVFVEINHFYQTCFPVSLENGGAEFQA